MHSCKETKEQITELLLDGADCRLEEALAGELRACTECRNEFDALRSTLRATKRSSELSAHTESYWIHYHAKLRQRIEDQTTESHARAQRRKQSTRDFFAPLLLRVRTTVAVPVPLLVALVVASAGLTVFAVFAGPQPVPQSPLIVHERVEVPVIQEKVVTQVVYRNRRSPTRTAKRASNALLPGESTFAKSRGREVPAAFLGFKPTEDVKLTVIKGGSGNEK